MGGVLLVFIMDVCVLEESVREWMELGLFWYVVGAVGLGVMAWVNREVFDCWCIVLWMLIGSAGRDCIIMVLGMMMLVSIIIVLVGVQSIVHFDGELVVARVIVDFGLLMIFLMVLSFTMEEVAVVNGDGCWWF